MPYPNWIGKKRFWTKEKVTEALARAAKEIKGPLPCHDLKYNQLKNGRLDWPTTHRILEYYHSMARAWLAAGAKRSRITFHNQDWTPEDDAYLLDYAGGDLTLKEIARRLKRTYPSVRKRLMGTHGIKARHNQGFVSAAELAREYGCSYQRIRDALKNKRIKGRFDSLRNRWEIDLADVIHSPAVIEMLKKPKRTHKTYPTDVGDYCKRKGLKRALREGKMVYVPVA